MRLPPPLRVPIERTRGKCEQLRHGSSRPPARPPPESRFQIPAAAQAADCTQKLFARLLARLWGSKSLFFGKNIQPTSHLLGRCNRAPTTDRGTNDGEPIEPLRRLATRPIGLR